MKFAAVLNRDGGTLRTTDLDDFSARIHAALEEAGHSVSIEIVSGSEIADAIDKAAAKRVDVVMVGGGDGTVSTAAAKLKGKKKALAILPAGTMNLFARSLQIPQTLDGAVKAFATGEIRAVDVATANGIPFVHQFSVGMHAKLVHLREQKNFASRLGKIRASLHAAWETIHNPTALDVKLSIGEAEILTKATSIGVTNNLFGEGHLPYTDQPDGGTLGVYITIAQQKGELVRLLTKMARGKWRDNDQIEIHEAQSVRLEVRSSKRYKRVIDGELSELEKVTDFKIHPGALNVLVPQRVEAKKAA
ncbi:diacylglycerol/lipid kinase family protein [Oryzicola mucosus]|uniref:Diacylglycerol kinase family lipid kinase n=1 Tax=Oryzicola mucosus TaxID=2767425 RepID=A0A8J6PZN4_9HYPH|nr:diacylglycerol kinase family protein [Oryzicola mucosus]MBD0417257.1 diacylglycerol kinase family lipid kinase [Oryzicola mucosus]